MPREELMSSSGLCRFIRIPGGLCNRVAKGECADCATDVCHDCGQPCAGCGEIICRLCEKDHLCKKRATGVRFNFSDREEVG